MTAKIIIGVWASVALLVGLAALALRIRLYTRGVRTTGHVVAGRVHMNLRPGERAGFATKPVIEVNDPSTRETFTFESSFGSSLTRIRVGEEVPVRHLPGDPESAEIDRLLPMWFFPFGTLLFSGLMFWVITRI
jgi:hypothetical protein